MLYVLLALITYVLVRTIFKSGWEKNKEQSRAHREAVDESLLDGLHTGDEVSREDILCEIIGEGGQISSLVFLPDGRIASTCRGDGTIRIWSMEHGWEVKPPMVLDVAVGTIAASKDGKWIISGAIDGNVAVWDTSSHQKAGKSSESHKLKITTLDVSSDSLCIASGSDDGMVMVWRVDSQPALRCDLTLRLQPEDLSPVSSVKFSPAGGRIASGYIHSGYYTIRIWHSRTGDQLAAIPTNAQPTRSLTWSRDGQRVFTGGPHGSIRCFDVITQRCLGKWGNSRSDLVTYLYVSNSGQFLVSASTSGRTLDVWDIRDISACKLLHSYQHPDVLSTAISPDELYIVSGGKDKKIHRLCLAKAINELYFFNCVMSSPRESEPLMCISNAAYELWTHGKLEETEKMLSNEIADGSFQDLVSYAWANRSLVRARLQKWDEALEDAKGAKLVNGQRLLLACIAEGIALFGKGQHKQAVGIFDTVLHKCHDSDTKRFVEHIKSITMEPWNVPYCDIEPSYPHQDVNPLVTAQRLVQLAEHSIYKQDYGQVLQLLSRAPDLTPFLDIPDKEAVFLVFGWNLYDLCFMIHQLKFQAFAATGCTNEAMELLFVNEKNISEDVEERKGILGILSEKLGDKELSYTNYDNAIAWYSMALALFPESKVTYTMPDLVRRCLATFEMTDTIVVPDEATALYLKMLSSISQRTTCLLLKRSKANAGKKMWKEALNDADEAIQLDPTCPWGYERRHAAIPTTKTHEDQIHGSNDILLTVERQIVQDISQIQQSHISCEVIIDMVACRIGKFYPLVLIDVTTGRLCDVTERNHIFKKDPIYGELLSSSTAHLDIKHIIYVVARFFRYVMFSHTWEGKEPTYQDVLGKSIYTELDLSSRLNDKLRNFCETVRNDSEGYRWSWSDTCCIDKTVEAVYKKSIRSMYDWYKFSALTLVLLADASKLKDNRWMTRAWTLQELLSPKSIRFYDRNWKPYQDDISTNHKKSPHILRELAEVIHVTPDVLIDFSPDSLGVREKLRLASTRNATVEEDTAYSLIGIFSSNLVPEPRGPHDATIALGLLLQEVVDRYQETTVLDWTGEPSKFSSCLPAHVSVYSQLPYIAPPISEDRMEKRVAELQGLSTMQQDAVKFYHKLSRLDPLLFVNHRLHLPCITFQTTVTKRDAGTQCPCSRDVVYLARSSALGEVEFTTADALSPQDTLIIIYPWIRDLLTQAHLPEDLDTQALRLIIQLERPFRALVLMKHRVHNEYRRVATDSEIIVPEHKVTLKDMDAERLVVL